MRLPRHIRAKLGFVGALALGASSSAAHAQEATATADASPTVGDYFEELQKSGNLDIESGSRDTLIEELRRAEALLRSSAYEDAAVALYAIVESPRYEGLEDFVEFQNSMMILSMPTACKRSSASRR